MYSNIFICFIGNRNVDDELSKLLPANKYTRCWDVKCNNRGRIRTRCSIKKPYNIYLFLYKIFHRHLQMPADFTLPLILLTLLLYIMKLYIKRIMKLGTIWINMLYYFRNVTLIIDRLFAIVLESMSTASFVEICK